eukprot:Sdes_comp23632_c0_seq1m21823
MKLIFFLAATYCSLIAGFLGAAHGNALSNGVYRGGDLGCNYRTDGNGKPFCDGYGPFYDQLLKEAKGRDGSNVFVGNIPPQDNGVQPMLPVGGPIGNRVFIKWCSPKATTDPELLGLWYVELLKKWATKGHSDGSVNTGGAIHDLAERTGAFAFTNVFFKVTDAIAHITGDLQSGTSCSDIVEKTGGQKVDLGWYYTVGPATYNDPSTSVRDVSQSI